MSLRSALKQSSMKQGGQESQGKADSEVSALLSWVQKEHANAADKSEIVDTLFKVVGLLQSDNARLKGAEEKSRDRASELQVCMLYW